MIVAHVQKLSRKGYRFEVAIEKTASKFYVSKRTVFDIFYECRKKDINHA